MNLQLLHDRVLVKQVDSERQSAGGIVLPGSASEREHSGIVVAVGHGRTDDNGVLRPLDVQPGQQVIFGQYSGQTVKIDGEEYLQMREDDIIGIVE